MQKALQIGSVVLGAMFFLSAALLMFVVQMPPHGW